MAELKKDGIRAAMSENVECETLKRMSQRSDNQTDDSQPARKLTEPELNHLLGLLEARKEEGSYCGLREQYYARTERLVKWCHEQIKQNVLRRRRRVMPDYDRKLEEWLS